ncbi:LAMI_0H09604g1_1 [Lachancea mirantina]|uniref:LAMI_0H09604g1_1 n=1 Tax=Lachancea mirantina TaxID=1230905 RepID=A0A1G4KGP3_9SACH|nr:LAMI_0H09604g1_1 [Lachancea mirantina]
MGGKHLIVLIHGLWGNHSHMNAIKEVFAKTLDDPNVIFFAPRQSGYFKTFDGIEIIGYRTLTEICQVVLGYKRGTITKISFIGYSMGGLISRFIIGKMFTECHDLFQDIEPGLFITFATPHLGVHFHVPEPDGGWSCSPHHRHRQLLSIVLSLLGTTILGRTGRQLFINDSPENQSILLQLSSGEFLEGLARFKHRICVANVKNDRTVAFYTSFITDCDPFLESENQIQYVFDPNLPGTDLRMVPRILDMNRLDPESQRAPKDDHNLSRWALVILICAILFFVLPLVFVANVVGTCYSYLATVHYQKLLHKGEGRNLLRRKLGLEDKLVDAIRDTVGVLANEESDDLNDDAGQSIIRKDISWDEFVSKYSHGWDQKSKSRFKALDFDPKRRKILQNLNQLSWIRIPIYIKSLNAHDGIVARKGVRRATPYSVSGLQFVAQLAKFLISKDEA